MVFFFIFDIFLQSPKAVLLKGNNALFERRFHIS